MRRENKTIERLNCSALICTYGCVPTFNCTGTVIYDYMQTRLHMRIHSVKVYFRKLWSVWKTRGCYDLIQLFKLQHCYPVGTNRPISVQARLYNFDIGLVFAVTVFSRDWMFFCIIYRKRSWAALHRVEYLVVEFKRWKLYICRGYTSRRREFNDRTNMCYIHILRGIT